MKRISTLTELKAERKLLQLHKTFLEAEIKSDFVELKKELEPLKIVTRSAGTLLSSENNKILGHSFGSLAGVLTKNVFLRNSGFITRLIIPFFAKNATSNLVEDHKPQIAHWIMKQVNRLSHKKTVGT
jgi:hypothetical protein